MDHQGIFRVPGSSTEINDMKEAFENGKNTLHDTVAEISVGWGGGNPPPPPTSRRIANLSEIFILSEVRRHMSYSIKRLLYQNFRQINWRLLLTT